MRNLKRALSLALASVMVMGLMVVGSGASYADVTSKNNTEAIEVLQKVGVMTGDENGNFNPEANVTRNEMAVIMSNLLDYKVSAYAGTAPFTDVPAWAEPYVAACYTHGIVAGVSATTFDGGRSVTATEAALMMMKALGYFQYGSDFGDSWTLAVVRQANKIDLYKGVDATVGQAMSRDDVAQLALNTLKSYQVEPDDDTINVSTGDVSVQAGTIKYYQIVSDDTMYKSISAEKGVNMSNIQGYTKELGEDLYDGDLKCSDTTDAFGRPSTIWTYKNSEIGTYSNTADESWTGKVSEKMLYAAAGSTAVKDYTWSVWVDGVEDDSYDATSLSKTSSDRWETTGTGVLTELYVDDDADKETVTVVIINTYVAEVSKVKDNGDDYTITLSFKNSGVSGIDKEFDTETKFSKDDIVIVTLDKAGKEIKTVALAETVEGIAKTVKSNDYLKIDGTTYNYNYGYTAASVFGKGLVDIDDGSNVNPTAGDKVTVYLDAYGSAVAIEGAEDSADDYLYVKGVETSFNDVTAKVVFSDGTEAVIDVDELKNEGKDEFEDADKDYVPVEEKVYKFNKSGSKYDLEYVEAEDLTDAKIEKGTASFGGFKANSDTVFVDTGDNKAWIGYKNVASMSDVDGLVVNDGAIAAIVFITDADDYDLDNDSYFFVKGEGDYDIEDTDEDTLYNWTVYVNGEKDTLTASSDLSKTITEPGLYKIKSTDSDGYITKVELVAGIDFEKVGETADAYATYATKGLLTLNGEEGTDVPGNLTGATALQTTFNYDDDTVFVTVEMKAGNKIDSVGVGSISDIEISGIDDTDGSVKLFPETTAVYVITVEDKGDATPLAEMVIVVVPHVAPAAP